MPVVNLHKIFSLEKAQRIDVVLKLLVEKYTDSTITPGGVAVALDMNEHKDAHNPKYTTVEIIETFELLEEYGLLTTTAIPSVGIEIKVTTIGKYVNNEWKLVAICSIY
jgi:hypothetical protein